MWVDRDTTALVQGITGKEGTYWTERMLAYGTRLAAGVTPGRGGQQVNGVPVYDTVQQAIDHHPVDVSVIFVPPLLAAEAALEAMEAGLKKIIVLSDGVPVRDTARLLARGRELGARVVGPNCPGVVAPGRTFIGIMPAWLEHVFRPGRVGVVSRSGSLANEVCYQVVQAGHGQSLIVGVGGDPIVGTTTLDCLRMFEEDSETEAAVVVGELGGTMEEDAAEFIPRMTKPVVAFIAGRMAPPGKRMGHAGAIVEGDKGTAESKVRCLEAAGARVARLPSELVPLLQQALSAKP